MKYYRMQIVIFVSRILGVDIKIKDSFLGAPMGNS